MTTRDIFALQFNHMHQLLSERVAVMFPTPQHEVLVSHLGAAAAADCASTEAKWVPRTLYHEACSSGQPRGLNPVHGVTVEPVVLQSRVKCRHISARLPSFFTTIALCTLKAPQQHQSHPQLLIVIMRFAIYAAVLAAVATAASAQTCESATAHLQICKTMPVLTSCRAVRDLRSFSRELTDNVHLFAHRGRSS